MRRWNIDTNKWEEVHTVVKTMKNGKQYTTVEVVEVDEVNDEGKLYNHDTQEWEIYNPAVHELVKTKEGKSFLRSKLSGTDRVMTDFAKKVNSHPDMNVRMLWQVNRNKRDDTFGEITFQGKNDPDYWLGVSYAAYTKSVIDRNEFTDILLALQGAGAKSTYFKEIVQKLGKGEI